MNRSEMILDYKAQLGGLADSTSNTEIIALFDRAYRYTLPTRVPGEMFEGEWSFEIAAGADTWDYDERVISLDTRRAKISEYNPDEVNDNANTSLRVWTDSIMFHDRFEPNRLATTTGKPTDVLLYARAVKFRPAPDVSTSYWVTFYGKLRPENGIGAAGREDDNWARAVTHLAALSTAQELSLDEYEQRINARLATYLEPLIEQSMSRGNQRKYLRSF